MDYKEKVIALLDSQELSKEQKEKLENIFPELKESEDERTRKAILTGLIDCRDAPDLGWSNFGGINIDECITWIKKQCEQKTAVYAHKFRVGNIVKSKSQPMLDARKIISIDEDCYWCEDKGCLGFAWEDDYELVEEKQIEQNPDWFEKQNGQTHAVLSQSEVNTTSDKELEQKFHPGDWIIDNEYGEVLKVTKADANSYEIINQDEEIFNILKEDIECNYHLWTIADAKDGDLIYISTEEKGIQAIFHEYKNAIIFCHCYLCTDFVQGGYMPIGSVELTYPLQKTHYNRFFEKMHGAGYEWDNDKKELKKKIDPKFHPGDWIVDDETPNDVFCVIEVLGEIYKVIDTDGNDYCIPHCKADNQFHLWSINDANV